MAHLSSKGYAEGPNFLSRSSIAVLAPEARFGYSFSGTWSGLKNVKESATGTEYMRHSMRKPGVRCSSRATVMIAAQYAS